MTASPLIVTLSPRRLGFCDGLSEVVTPPCVCCDGLVWRRHQFCFVKPKRFWLIMSNLPTSDFTSSWCRHSLDSDAVTSSDSLGFFDFVVFRTFSLRKRPKMLLLWFSPQKYLKWEKKRLWVKSNQIIYELELKLTPKNVTFFVSSGCVYAKWPLT